MGQMAGRSRMRNIPNLVIFSSLSSSVREGSRKGKPRRLGGGVLTGLPIAAPSGRGLLGEAGPVAICPEDRYPLAAAIYLDLFCDLFKALPPGAR